MRENALRRGNAHRPNVFGNALGNEIVDKLTPSESTAGARLLKALQSQANMTEAERAQVEARLRAMGDATFTRQDGDWADRDGNPINGAYDRETGKILISGQLLDAAVNDPHAAATLQRVLYEEQGHRVASALENIRGVADLAGDEGAILARSLLMEDVTRVANGGEFGHQVSVNVDGKALSFNTDARHLAVASLELFDQNYLTRDRQDGRYEYSTMGKVVGGLSAAYELGDSPLLKAAKQDLQAQIRKVGGDSLGAQALSLAVDLVFPENWTEVIPAGKLFSFGGKVLHAAGDIRGAVARGALNPKVAEAAAKGQKMHKDWSYGPGFEKEVTLPNGKRADAVNFETREVVELKPNNQRAINRGEKQAASYRKELEQWKGGNWTHRVETYD